MLRRLIAASCSKFPLAYRGLATATTPQVSGFSGARLPNSQSYITPKLHFFNSVTPDGQQIPTYRVLDGVGKVLEGANEPEIDEVYARRLYEHMQLLPALDTVLYNVQRQGKISFYVSCQ
ncbi:hypothetical protein E1B28_012211 [Marasmius oreades]|uniref:2-oxoisovalerate dehydrogenase subunit alpha n=1 Tax=Marasmius oreades TaxID=181124 RepID=A0A9P7RR27_9AGAR|nr:uncharacterized protein E1B28_012211 [Marasmius oreades]KAG7088194.1 hypothetical protein E1B28_012211 [Marasmius oreades]